MKYFTISELIYSDTARARGIDNSPTTEVRANLVTLVNTILDPLREAWHSPIIVTSGYRCGILNRAVGGSNTSSHLYGCAVDIYPQNGKIAEFKEFCSSYFADKRHLLDQLLLEKQGTREWVHIGLKTKDGRKRGQIAKVNDGKWTYL